MRENNKEKIISVIIPCYNEEKTLPDTLKKIKEFISKEQKHTYKFIFVDDGSTDATHTYLKEDENTIVLWNRVNKGKGYSIKKGVLASCSDYIFFIDADLAVDINYIKDMVDIMESTDYDIVIGERDLKSRSPLRKLLSRGCNKILVKELPLLKDIKDTQCGLKGFKTGIAKQLFSNLNEYGFSFDIEILFNALKEGKRIHPVQVDYHESKIEETSVNVFLEPFRFYKRIKRIKNG